MGIGPSPRSVFCRDGNYAAGAAVGGKRGAFLSQLLPPIGSRKTSGSEKPSTTAEEAALKRTGLLRSRSRPAQRSRDNPHYRSSGRSNATQENPKRRANTITFPDSVSVSPERPRRQRRPRAHRLVLGVDVDEIPRDPGRRPRARRLPNLLRPCAAQGGRSRGVRHAGPGGGRRVERGVSSRRGHARGGAGQGGGWGADAPGAPAATTHSPFSSLPFPGTGPASACGGGINKPAAASPLVLMARAPGMVPHDVRRVYPAPRVRTTPMYPSWPPLRSGATSARTTQPAHSGGTLSCSEPRQGRRRRERRCLSGHHRTRCQVTRNALPGTSVGSPAISRTRPEAVGTKGRGGCCDVNESEGAAGGAGAEGGGARGAARGPWECGSAPTSARPLSRSLPKSSRFRGRSTHPVRTWRRRQGGWVQTEGRALSARRRAAREGWRSDGGG